MKLFNSTKPTLAPRGTVTLLEIAGSSTIKRMLLCSWLVGCMSVPVFSQGNFDDLPRLTPGKTGMQNGLYFEVVDLSNRFDTSKRVIVADLKGPGTITMLHFALPQKRKLNRDLLIKIYWDGEKDPSVDCPLVDFFCDPAGMVDEIASAWVAKHRGWNGYFPMPYRTSARIELVYDGPLKPGLALWNSMSAYSYVQYRTADKIPEDAGYFHACWRQEVLLLSNRQYEVLNAKGKGKFVGCNICIRRLGRPTYPDYPVDENEMFFIDGESSPSYEFMGLEDFFSFSWGFPSSRVNSLWVGYTDLPRGAAAYRFFNQDSISFAKSLRMTLGFGKLDEDWLIKDFGTPGNELEISSTAYWYQTEPHAPLPPMPPAAERAPASNAPKPEAAKQGVFLTFLCGYHRELVFAEPGYSAVVKSGKAQSDWKSPTIHSRYAEKTVEVELTVPKGVAGKVRMFVVDPDNYEGGRKQTVTIAGKPLGVIENFQQGRWLEQPLTAADIAEGKILIQATNARQGSDAVISVVEWVQ